MRELGHRSLTRRGFLAGSASAGLIWSAPAATAAPQGGRQVADGVTIIPRATWGGDLVPTGPLEAEASGDVRFLLVHHTVDANRYEAEEAVGLLRSIYGFHTSSRGWSDVAYNFFVDRFGRIYEGRTGSLEAPIKGDARGGSQGFAVLCAFVGDHRTEAPTEWATAAMVGLLGWLADTYQIDTAPGAAVSFVSRGSSLHPVGTEVTAATISGHRDMSSTECPGDAGYRLVTDVLPAAVSERRRPAATSATTLPTGTVPPVSFPPPPTTGSEAAATQAASETGTLRMFGVGGLVAGGALGAAIWARTRRRP